MELRLPGSTDLFALLGPSTTTADLTPGDDAIAMVTPAQLDDAIAALARGDVEYLGLHHGDAFVQVAGEGVGPYQLEASLGTIEQQVVVPGGVTLDGVRVALHGFLAGDDSWPQSFPWEHLAPPPPRRTRRWFGRG